MAKSSQHLLAEVMKARAALPLFAIKKTALLMFSRFSQPKVSILTCHNVGIAIFALVFRALRVLGSVFVKARVRPHFLVFFAKSDVLELKIAR